jgi:hypothetical protein
MFCAAVCGSGVAASGDGRSDVVVAALAEKKDGTRDARPQTPMQARPSAAFRA